jgi:hypothetical protein
MPRPASRPSAFTALLIVVAFTFASAAKDETVDELKARFESAHLEERAELGVKIAQAQLRNADKLYIGGDATRARAAVDDIASYSEKARDAAIETNKHLKNVEIAVRKMAEKLRDIKGTLAFDDQPPVDQAIHRLENVRTTLLKAMFGNDEKKQKK